MPYLLLYYVMSCMLSKCLRQHLLFSRLMCMMDLWKATPGVCVLSKKTNACTTRTMLLSGCGSLKLSCGTPSVISTKRKAASLFSLCTLSLIKMTKGDFHSSPSRTLFMSESTDVIGTHLSPPDLLSCILVCRTWNSSLSHTSTKRLTIRITRDQM